MKLKATRDGDGWRLNGQKTWTTSAHFAEWYWVGARTDPESKHQGITLFLVPLDHPNITINGIWTMGDERTNDVFFDDVFVHDDYVVGDLNHGFQYISEALDLERFTMFSLSPIQQRLDLLVDYVNTPPVDGQPPSAALGLPKNFCRCWAPSTASWCSPWPRLAGRRARRGGWPPTAHASSRWARRQVCRSIRPSTPSATAAGSPECRWPSRRQRASN